jgi:general secretion pathway protein A
MTNFNDFWQIERSVFLQSLEPKDTFFPLTLKNDLERLLLLCKQPQTVAFLIGAKGTGKSTYLKWLNSQLPVDQYDTLLTTMISPEPQSGWLARRLSEFFGNRGQPSTSDYLLRGVVARLDELIDENRKLIVFIDAAHMATTAESWQELASLMSLQALAEPCVSFVLCGEPRLLQLFSDSESLATHVSFALEVQTMSEAETSAYLRHRLDVANLQVEIQTDALRALFDESRGVIARVNTLGENFLIECSMRESRVVTKEIVLAANRYIAGKPPHISTLHASTGGLAMPLTALYRPATAVGASTTTTPPEPVKTAEPEPSPGNTDTREKDIPGIRLASLFKSDGSRKR